MDSDRELLELAAKAAGIEGEIKKTFGGWPCLMRKNGHAWQPMHDDGAALNLAVKLGIEIIPDREVEEVSTAFCVYHPRLIGYNTVEPFGIDEMAATRRAIVRAAAEIGKAMP